MSTGSFSCVGFIQLSERSLEKLIFIVSCLYEPNVTSVVQRLTQRNIRWFRFNTETFPLTSSISLYDSDAQDMFALIKTKDVVIDTREITSVWCRRFGDLVLPSTYTGRDERFARNECLSLIHSMYSCMQCFWVNPKNQEAQAGLKTYQLQVAKEVGFSTPRTLITNDPQAVVDFAETASGRVIFKPVAGAAFAGLPPQFTQEMREQYPASFAVQPADERTEQAEKRGAVFAQILAKEHTASLNEIIGSPVVFQTYIDKMFELRITIVGDDIFAAEIHSQEHESTKIDFRHLASDLSPVPTHKIHYLPDDISRKLMLLMKKLGLVFGCIDMILTPQGEYVFLEINPSGQYQWIEHYTGMPITDAITDLLIKGHV